jgi:hypothetical protein
VTSKWKSFGFAMDGSSPRQPRCDR